MVSSNDGPDRAAHLIPRGFAGDEAEQVQDISQSDPGSDSAKCMPGTTVLPEFDTDSCICANAAQHKSGMALGTEKRNP